MPDPSSKPDESIASLRSIGPAIIVASVVVGPGSILTSSKVGHEFGYSMCWVLLLAGLLMIGMVTLAGRLGITLSGTLCDELAVRLGRPLTASIGIVMFLVVAAFQSSNNIAVVTSVEQFIGSAHDTESDATATMKYIPSILLVCLNVLIIVAIYGMRHLYVPIERTMKALVLIMIVGFAGNVFFARPSLVSVFEGLVPTMPQSSDWLPLLGLFGTTFSVAGAFYQGYLVREKGWDASNIKQGTFDSVIGISVLCLTTMVIMVTSAAVLHGQEIELESASDVGAQLEPLFGPAAAILFNIGLLAGALSSFLVNAMIGGTVLSDSFGLGFSMDGRWPKAFTVAALLFGMVVAIAATAFDFSRVGMIVFAQALTVIGMPLLAISLLFLGTRKNASGTRNAPPWIVVLAVLGTLMSVILAARTASAVVDKLS